MEDGWMTGVSYEQANAFHTAINDATPDEDAILGIESVYNEESSDAFQPSVQIDESEPRPDSSLASSNVENNSREDESMLSDPDDVEDEIIMWKCAKCPEEFPDKESVKQHVQAVHKKNNEANKVVYEDTSNNMDLDQGAEEWDYSPAERLAPDEEYEFENADYEDLPRSDYQQNNWSSAMPKQSKSASTKNNVRSRKQSKPIESYEDITAGRPKPWATKSINCDICHFQVSTPDALKRHMIANSHKPRIWKCKYCSELFVNKTDSDVHISSRHLEEQDGLMNNWNCDLCDRPFNSEFEFMHHQFFHGVKAPWQCPCCERKYEKLSSLKTHEQAELNKYYGGGFRCPACDEAFLTSKELTTHQRTVHSAHGPMKCSYCEKLYNTFEALRRHEITHTSEKPWNCVKCFERFSEKVELNDHMKEMHGEEDKTGCEKCGRTFGRLAALKQHELICLKPDDYDNNDDGSDDQFEGPKKTKSYRFSLEKKEKPKPPKRQSKVYTPEEAYKCKYCRDSFTLLQSLEWHQLTRHADKKKFGCNHCSERFFDQAKLKQHILSTHTVINGFKCSLCPKIFSKREYLRIHSKCHIGERRFKCTQLDCDETFFSPQKRTEHLLNAHGLTEQIFQCQNCDQQFEKQRELERHELTHLKTKADTNNSSIGKFKCSTCGKSFMQEFVLKMHEKVHEPNQSEYNCEHCDKKFKNIASRNIHSRKAHPDVVKAAIEEIVLD